MSVHIPAFSVVPGVSEVPRRLRSSLPAADYQGFFDAVGEALKLHMQEQHVPAEWNVTYVEEYPKDRDGSFDQSFDVILYSLEQAVPAGTDPTGKARVPRGPVRREAVPHPTMARYHLVTDGWWENIVVEFQVLAKSNRRANEMATWFHRFMYQYAFAMKFFLERGVSNFQFVGRGSDEKTADFGQELYRRRLQYACRLEFLNTYLSKDLERLHVELTAQPNTSPIKEFDWSVDGRLNRQT